MVKITIRACIAFILGCVLLGSCSKGGGSGGGGLAFTGTNIVPNSQRKINEPVVLHFNKAIDLESVDLASVAIEAIPSVTAGAPTPGPVVGEFFLQPDSGGSTVVFQPLCPTLGGGSWGFEPGNQVEGVLYRVRISGREDAEGPLLQATDGSTLGSSVVFEFTTASPPNPIVRDPQPTGPPRIVRRDELPETLGLNLLSQPNDPLTFEFDQPLDPESVGTRAISFSFEHDGFGVVSIPTEVALTRNCTVNNGARVTVMPIGVLPPGKEIQMVLSGAVAGLGGEGDSHGVDLPFHKATVQDPVRPVQMDALLESFDTREGMDPNPAFLFPLARWEDGLLEAGTIYPGNPSDIVIEIGPGTVNGTTIQFNTEGQLLRDTLGQEVFFGDGILDVGTLHLKNGGGTTTTLRAIGRNPLIIRATNSVIVEKNARIDVSGTGASDVYGVGTANQPAPGGPGHAGGGDGGIGSPLRDRSSAKGGNGNGPFNIPFAGANGGHAAYGDARQFPGKNWQINARPAGGAGGTLGREELGDDDGDGVGEYLLYSWGEDYWKIICDPNDFGCQDNEPSGCGGGTPYNSTGENGSNGSQCVENNSPQCKKKIGQKRYWICQLDATDGTCWARGGLAVSRSFSDSDPANNFQGRKPVLTNGGVIGSPETLEIIQGELSGYTAGQGGGGGGDAVRSVDFPSDNFPGSSGSTPINLKGAGGGGGAGILHIISLGPVDISGELIANGGRGGQGEETNINTVGAGGGGGGSGGMIIIETPSGLSIGNRAVIQARGGQRGMGGGVQPGWDNSQNERQCRKTKNGARGGAGGKGIIQFHLPFVEESSVSCGGIKQPRLAPGALMYTSSGNTYEIPCERDLTQAGRFGVLPTNDWSQIPEKIDPSPQILISTFGSRTAAQSRWHYLGWQSVAGEVAFGFEGINPVSGVVDPSFEKILASGSGAASFSEHAVTLQSAALADLLRSAPAARIQDGFRPATDGPVYSILTTAVEGDAVTLELDPAAGFLQEVGSWEVLDRSLLTLQDGAPTNGFAPTAETRILFQGAHAVEPGSMIPDPETVTEPTASIASLNGYQLIRFQVHFETNKLGGPLDPFLERPGLAFVKALTPFE